MRAVDPKKDTVVIVVRRVVGALFYAIAFMVCTTYGSHEDLWFLWYGFAGLCLYESMYHMSRALQIRPKGDGNDR